MVKNKATVPADLSRDGRVCMRARMCACATEGEGDVLIKLSVWLLIRKI